MSPPSAAHRRHRKMKSRLIGTTVFLAALAGLALMTVPGTPRAQTGPTLSIDTDPLASPANSASTVGSIESCVSVSSSPVPFEIDMTIQGVTSLSAVEGDLIYDESVLTIMQMDDGFILAQGEPPPILLNFSDPLPDTDGDNKFHIVLASTGEGSGEGVIARFTIQPDAPGTSPLTLDKMKLRDFDNAPIGPVDDNDFYVGPVNNGTAAVDTACSPDSDNDGVPDATDNCPSTHNPGQENNVHPLTPPGDHCEDPEPDGVFDISDNCPDAANPAQENTDADLEAAGASVSGDALGDACDEEDDNDSGPETQDPGLEAATCPPDVLPVWADCVESYLTTDLVDNCSADGVQNNEPLDAWPPDLNDDRSVDILDIIQSPTGLFGAWGARTGDPEFTARSDLNADGSVDILDVIVTLFPFWGEGCT